MQNLSLEFPTHHFCLLVLLNLEVAIFNFLVLKAEKIREAFSTDNNFFFLLV
jgi:hypothetical protein